MSCIRVGPVFAGRNQERVLSAEAAARLTFLYKWPDSLSSLVTVSSPSSGFNAVNSLYLTSISLSKPSSSNETFLKVVSPSSTSVAALPRDEVRCGGAGKPMEVLGRAAVDMPICD